MRNPNRIAPFTERIAAAWSKMSEQRYGQLMLNFFHWLESQNKVPFYMEDEELISQFESWVAIFTDPGELQ